VLRRPPTVRRTVIFYGFSGYGGNSPELVDYRFSTSFAFPNAKPATTAKPGWGGRGHRWTADLVRARVGG
jgi:hypothetical protein